jgi:hypothetical protein
MRSAGYPGMKLTANGLGIVLFQMRLLAERNDIRWIEVLRIANQRFMDAEERNIAQRVEVAQ